MAVKRREKRRGRCRALKFSRKNTQRIKREASACSGFWRCASNGGMYKGLSWEGRVPCRRYRERVGARRTLNKREMSPLFPAAMTMLVDDVRRRRMLLNKPQLQPCTSSSSCHRLAGA